jgi:mannose-1-phosphate guanylyltransferase
MAGGVGQRFWPRSRESNPKQLINIVGEKSLITQTAERNFNHVSPEQLYVITTKSQAEDISAAIGKVPKQNIIAEPYGRNTAPCIGLVCALLAAKDPGTVLAVVPADHWIPDIDIFSRTIRNAAEIASREKALVTLGIKPRGPETGYGYILAGKTIDFAGKTTFSKVDKFIEKPEKRKAEKLIANGNAFWNAGMFVFKISEMLNSFQKFLPDFYEGLIKIRKAASTEYGTGTSGLEKIIEEVYSNAPKISIDYAIMEKAENVIVAQSDFNWDDIGSWASVANHLPKDKNNNAVRGNVATVDSSDCVIENTGKSVIGLVGVENLIVVQTDDALLICKKDKDQDVKKLVEKLKNNPELKKFTE